MKIAFFSTWRKIGGWPDHSEFIIKGLERLQVECFRCPLDNDDIKKEDLIKSMDFEKINRCDAAHVQYEMSFFTSGRKNIFPFFISKIRIPKIVTLHEVYSENPYVFPYSCIKAPNMLFLLLKRLSYWYRHPQYYAELKLCRRNFFSDYITVHSEYHIPILRSLGVNTKFLSVVEHGIPFVHFKEKNAIKSAYGFSGKKIILTFGFLYPTNNYSYIIRALRYLPEEFIYIIAGGVRDASHAGIPENVKKFARLNGVENRVHITGFIEGEKRDDYLNMADIYTAPFEVKSISGSMSWAIGAGLPILTPRSQMTDDINARVACLMLYESASPDSFMEQIMRLANNRELQNQLSEKAKEYSRNYSYEIMAKKIKDVYEKILSKS
ncbi:MAG: glycosyltransferase [Elusimicrobiota bacterium]